MNILFLLLFWSLWFLNYSTRTVLSPLMPIFEKDLHISHALAGSIFLFMAVGYTSSLLVSNWITPRIGFKRSIAVGFVVLIVALASLVLTDLLGSGGCRFCSRIRRRPVPSLRSPLAHLNDSL